MCLLLVEPASLICFEPVCNRILSLCLLGAGEFLDLSLLLKRHHRPDGHVSWWVVCWWVVYWWVVYWWSDDKFVLPTTLSSDRSLRGGVFWTYSSILNCTVGSCIILNFVFFLCLLGRSLFCLAFSLLLLCVLKLVWPVVAWESTRMTPLWIG